MSVHAPYPSKMDDINGKSIVSIERTTTDVTFRNRAGAAVGTFTIRNPLPSAYVQCLRRIGAFDSDNKDVLIKEWARPFNSSPKLANPATLPGSNGYSSAWSPDGKYFAMTTASTPGLVVYKRDGDTFTKLADPAYTTSGGGGIEWSPDGQYLTLGISSSPYIVIYKRSGDVLTKLSNPATLPAGTVNSTSWSSDGVYLACGHNTSPYLTIYKRAGDVFTKLADPADFPTSAGMDVSFSPGTRYLAVAHSASPHFTVYKRTGDVFVKLGTPSGGYPLASCFSIAWSPNGRYLAVGVQTYTIYVYKRNGDTLTLLSFPTESTGFTIVDFAWSPDSKYLACVTNLGSPYLFVYKLVGDVFTMLPQVATLPAGSANGTDWSPDGKHLVVTHSTTPYLSIYKSALGPVPGVAIRIVPDTES